MRCKGKQCCNIMKRVQMYDTKVYVNALMP